MADPEKEPPDEQKPPPHPTEPPVIGPPARDNMREHNSFSLLGLLLMFLIQLIVFLFRKLGCK